VDARRQTVSRSARPATLQLPDLLLEAEDYAPEARAYRDAAHQRAPWAAWSLALEIKPMHLAELCRRLDRETLIRRLAPHCSRDTRIADWLDRGIEDRGAPGLDRALGILLDGPAIRGGLRTSPEVLRLEDESTRVAWSCSALAS
jgi:hypothetical protein